MQTGTCGVSECNLVSMSASASASASIYLFNLPNLFVAIRSTFATFGSWPIYHHAAEFACYSSVQNGESWAGLVVVTQT